MALNVFRCVPLDRLGTVRSVLLSARQAKRGMAPNAFLSVHRDRRGTDRSVLRHAHRLPEITASRNARFP